MKNTRFILLAIALGIVVFLTALLATTYRTSPRPRYGVAATTTQTRASRIMQKLGKAYAAMEENHRPDAERLLQEILATEPQHPLAMRMLGRLLYEGQRYPEAEAIYRKMIARNEFDASAHNNLGQVLFRQNRLPEAKISLLRAIELNQAAPLPHLNLAGVYSAMNQPEEMRNQLEIAQRLLNRPMPAMPRGETKQ